MESHYHGYSTSALMSEAWTVITRRHRGEKARHNIASLAFETYEKEVLPQYRAIKIKQHDDPCALIDAQAKKIDDFASETRTVRWTDSFEFFVARAIDQLYGYKYTQLLQEITVPSKPVVSSPKDLNKIFNSLQREYAEAVIEMANNMLDGLHNDSDEDLLRMRRQASDPRRLLSEAIAAIDSELASRKKAVTSEKLAS